MAVRHLGVEEAGWAAEMMAARRGAYARYSPVFWRPRRGMTEEHAGFLERQVQDPDIVALRTSHGFVIAQCRDREGLIDDFAIDGEGAWADDGRELLTAAWDLLSARGLSVVRVVTAQADEPKVAMLVAAGLRLLEQWWVKPIEGVNQGGVAHGRVDRSGFSGILAPAPPVYDPGGPVLLADRVSANTDLSVVEDEAARMGSVLVILPTEPGSERERALPDSGWAVASQWYLGQPH
ncbi:MAG: hypothetical protein M3140_10840 [Actinomycetota bacterium]|nr:hypothetical protein [Actinomycetota bacterium]